MINKQTVRIGTVQTENEAARIYDFLALLTEGINVSFFIFGFIFFHRQKLILITRSNNWKQLWPNSFTTITNMTLTNSSQQHQTQMKKAKHQDKDHEQMKLVHLIFELASDQKETTAPWTNCNMNLRNLRIRHSKLMRTFNHYKIKIQ